MRTEVIRINGLKAGGEPPVLAFSDSTGEYKDEIATLGNVLVISVPAPSEMKGDDWTRIAEVVDGAKKAGFSPLLLLTGNKTRFDNLTTLVPETRDRLSSHVFFSDRKTLLAMNRSNGGATWFNDGQLIRKFHSSKLPSDESLLEMTGDNPTETMLQSSTKGRLRFQGFLLYTIALLLLI